jgi:hypothetical protein
MMFESRRGQKEEKGVYNLKKCFFFAGLLASLLALHFQDDL